jgi:glycosyltransferase involved in cell wall biosynthesis
MKTVVINALNSNSGGGKSIRDSFVRLLDATPLDSRYVVFTAHDADLEPISNPNLKILRLPAFLGKKALAPFTYRVALGRYIDRCGASVVLNLCDVIIKTRAQQIYVLDWPYVLNVHEKVWSSMSPRDQIIVWSKLMLHRLFFKEPAVVIAQTDEIRSILIDRYGLVDVRVIGNAPTLVAESSSEQFDAPLPQGVRFVCPSMYYPHKNLEILLDVAQMIKERGTDYRIIVTVTPNTPAAARFVASISERQLQDVVVNVGQVPLGRMQSLYAQCQALVLPTLLESYSIVYPEAMAEGLPIVTSDLWFARAVCGEAASYCNPVDAVDILRAMDAATATQAARNQFAGQLRSVPKYLCGVIGLLNRRFECCCHDLEF